MNRQQHRLVFNRARGALMAVGEGARSVRKCGSGQGARRGAVVVAIAAAIALLCAPGVATAQIAADPGAPGAQRPTVLAAPNGVPLVNIQTPSAAGVSRNTYQRFDVDGRGAILNNSRTDAPTHLGGWVAGNPWLAAGAARVILNEVNSAHPSHLNGWVEVAGQRAEVVIANPAGIRVNGAGFINASGVTLTTGTPVFNGGALDAYLVQRGQIHIDGAGLDTREADHAAVLARSVQLNAGLWATRLNVVVGASTVDAARHTPTGPATPTGATPAFALDVAQLGGMYAGHIHLVGTEAGLGVNSRGVIAAESGRLTLDTRGQLVNQGVLLAAGDMALHAAQLVNDAGAATPHNPTVAPAVIAAGGTLTLRADTLDNRHGALIHSEGDMHIAGVVDSASPTAGPARAVNNLSATIEAQGNLVLSTQSLRNERSGVDVTQVGVLDQTARLAMPSWWVNGRNEHGAPIAATSNYAPYHYYLLNPASILSEQTLITPDGNRIQRIEVALDPSDSIHHAAAGAYGGQYGVRGRLSVGAPTTAVLYVQQRVDGVANPDQVSGSPDVFAAQTATVHTWQQDTLTHSTAYGRCTTHCTLLVVQPGYGNPLTDLLRSDQTHLVPTHAGLELSRTARHTALEDRLNPGAGAPAALRAGGAMRLDIGESLVNRHADILARTTLDVIAPDASVTNEGRTLYRRHQFAITSHTAALGDFDWSRPGINEVLGQLGGRLGAGQQLTLQARSLSNIDPGPASGPEPLGSGLQFAGVSFPGAGAPLLMANHSLFRPAPPQRDYLVETDPRFTQHRAWLGSDYLLQRLADGHDLTLKRLGDGWHEQKLVREQVAELTGQRLLDGFGSDEAQLRALMDAGIAQAQTLQLRAGVALSAAQVAQLSTDLVWLVPREVLLPDGSTTQALVPQVYLRSVPRDELLPSGALLAGRQVSLQITQDLVNAGGRIEGDVVLAQTGRDLANIGGLMQARSELLAQAGRDVTITSPTHTTTFAGRHVAQSHTTLAGVGTVRVTGAGAADDDVGGGGRLTLQAGQDVVLQGARVGNADAGGNTTLQAGRDVQLQTVSVGSASRVVADARNHRHSSEQRESGNNIAVQGSLDIRAGQDVIARAASVQAQGSLNVQAGENIHLQAGRAVSESASSQYHKRSGPLSSKHTEVQESAASDVAIGSRFGGADVKLQAGHDIAVQGSEVHAQHTLRVDAGRDVLIASEENHASGSYAMATRKSGFSADAMSGISKGKSEQHTNQAFTAVTQAGSSVSGSDVQIQSGRDTVVRSSNVLADQDISVIAARDARVEAGSDRYTTTDQSRSRSTRMDIASGVSGRFTIHGKVQSEQDGTTAGNTAVQSLLSANGGSLTVIAGTDSQHQGTGAGNVNTQGGTLLARDTVALSGNEVTLGTADSQGASQQRAQTRTFTVGSQPSGVIGSAITALGDMVEVARHSDNDRLRAAAALKAGHDAYKLAGTQGADFVAAAGTAQAPGDPSAAGFGVSVSVGSSKSRQSENQTSTRQAGTVIQADQIDIQARDGDISATGAKLQARSVSLQAADKVNLQAASNTAQLQSNSNSGSAGLGVTFGFGEQNGISFQVSASRGRSTGEGGETIHDNTVLTGTERVRIKSGGDTNLRGAQVAGEKVTVDVGGDLNIQTLQDSSHYESEQKNTGVSLSVCVPPICYGNVVTGSLSMAREKIDHDFRSANEQSGIAAGAGGFDIRVSGNTDLKGAAVTSSAPPDMNRLSTGTLTHSDLTNTQRTQADSESTSIGYGGGSLVATVVANAVANALGSEMGGRGLPEDRNDRSTTQSVISPATSTITSGDAASEAAVAALTARDASTANQALRNTLTLQQTQALKAQQDEARQHQIAANYVGAVLTHTIGDVAQQQGWPDGSWQKTALHGLAGLVQAKVAGTDPAKAMTAAMLNEQLAPVLADHLKGQGIDPRSAEFRALMTAGSALLGSAFDAAQVAVTATVNNYLKHADVDKLEIQLKACGDSQNCRDKAFDDAYRTSAANDIELLNCKTTANCDQLKAEYRAGYAAIEGMLDKGIKPDDVSLILNMETNAQTIIRRGLDQLPCNTSACQERANYLVGVGKGLAKVTPAGLVTGSGVVAYELTTALLNLGLTDTAVALAQGIAGLPAELQQRLGSEDPQIRGEALVDALAIGSVSAVVTAKLGQVGYAATMRRIEVQAAAAKEAETIAARMREVAIHTDDARFSQVAQEIVSAERAGWKTADGKTWWPPEYGKVPGTEQIVELKVGQRLDRFGGTGKDSSFLAPVETPIGQRALPNTIDLSARDEFIVIKPFSVEESRVMPWFGKDGMGIQYETISGSKKAINDLIKDGYLKKVTP